MAHISTSKIFLALAACAAGAGVALHSPGAWAAAAAWGSVSAAAALWSRAGGESAKLQDASEAAERAYAEGVPGAGATREAVDIRGGALMAIGAMLCAFVALVGIVGAFVSGFGWGLAALAPVALSAGKGVSKALEE